VPLHGLREHRPRDRVRRTGYGGRGGGVLKPAQFEHVAPASLAEAVAALAAGDDDVKVLAGGQSLVPLLAFRFAQPSLLVDLNRIAELAFVREAEDGGLVVGAMTRTHQLEADPRIAARWPLAAAAVQYIGHRQIRNRGTIGGSIAHADPAAELPAVALASRVRLAVTGPHGTREIPAAEFFRTYFTTALEPDEILTEIRIPKLAPRTGAAFVEVARRHGDFALVGAAATVTLAGDGVADAAVVLISVGDTPVEVTSAAEILRGSPLTEESARAVGAAASAAVEPGSDMHASSAYRKRVAAVVTRRALLEAAGRADAPL
jgi:carbon-monoxide dehydrogenase medium subunit